MSGGLLLLLLILIPTAFAAGSFLFSSARSIIGTAVIGVLFTSVVGGALVCRVLQGGPLEGLADWLRLDALAAFHLAIMLIIFSLSSLFAWVYFNEELCEERFHLPHARIFSCLWCATLSAMTLVIISNNLAMMWVGVEATTLLTAFLICVHMSRGALEAMWKYLLICSVGIAFAFIGTLLVVCSAQGLPLSTNEALLWSELVAHAASLDPVLIKTGFIFILVGYGTKTGLAPMHSWLPDAHSKAPAPVSALFSGFMLNASLYCVMRYIPIVHAATGSTGWPLKLLIGFGLVSIVISSAFILFQRDLKRLLAYHSVEHLGIITLGLGLGGLGTFAALFHTLNHSLCKTLSFFAAGRLGQHFGTHDMEKMSGSLQVSRIWGVGILASILALIGVAPFALFISELQILKAALDKGYIAVLIVFLIATGTVFVGALAHALPLAWGSAQEPSRAVSTHPLEIFLVVFPLASLVILGLWMPAWLDCAMREAAAIVEGTGIIVTAHFGGGG